MQRQFLPTTNGDDQPVVPMSEEQKYLFDLKGWITLPGLLDSKTVDRVRQHQMDFLYQRDSLPPEERDNHGGDSQILLDHPVVVGILNEIISHQALASEDAMGFDLIILILVTVRPVTIILIHMVVVAFSISVVIHTYIKCKKDRFMPV